MASTIQLKTGTGNAVPSSLTQGEVGINVDNGLIYFGSGSGNKVKKLETFLNITASISGGIGGNISASGNIIGDHFIGLNDVRLIENNSGVVTVGFQNNTPIALGKSANPITLEGNITASGNISASGNILTSGDLDVLGEIECDHLNIADVDDGIHFGDTQVLFIDASNNVNFGVDGNSVVDLELYGHNHTYTAGGSITLDAGGDINLDAAGDNIRFKDAGTTTADLNTNTGKFTTIGDISSSGDITARLNNTTGFMLGSLVALSGDANNILYLGNNNTWEKIIYGRQEGDQHHLIGNVTASGNISASGTMQVSDSGYFIGTQASPVLSIESSRLRLSSSNDIFMDSGDDIIFKSEGTEIVHIRGDEAIFEVTGDTDLNGNLDTSGHITASGDISASGNFIGHRQFDLPGATGTTQGDIVYFGSPGPDFAEGKLHYWRSNGTWQLADKDAELGSGAALLGFALGSAVTDGILLRGMFRYGSDLGTLADVIYVGDSGVPTNDISGFASGDFIRVIGYLLESTNGTIWFNPDSTYIEKA